MTTENKNDYDNWKQQSVEAMKTKIQQNISQRAPIFQQEINNSITQAIIQFRGQNWTSVSSMQQFKLPQSLINSSIQSIFGHVSEWKGVNVANVNKKPTKWSEYDKRADNWWNTHKKSWIGDYFYHPLLSQILPQYIINITQQHYQTNNEQKMQLMRDRLFFYVFSKIVHAEISFRKTKKQPLILDHSFTSSKLLKKFFTELANTHKEPWNIHRHQNRFIVRNSVREWTEKILVKLSPNVHNDSESKESHLQQQQELLQISNIGQNVNNAAEKPSQRLDASGVIPADDQTGPPQNVVIVPPVMPNLQLPSPYPRYPSSAPNAYSPVHSPPFVTSKSVSPFHMCSSPRFDTRVHMNRSNYQYQSQMNVNPRMDEMNNVMFSDTDSYFNNDDTRFNFDDIGFDTNVNDPIVNNNDVNMM